MSRNGEKSGVSRLEVNWASRKKGHMGLAKECEQKEPEIQADLTLSTAQLSVVHGPAASASPGTS